MSQILNNNAYHPEDQENSYLFCYRIIYYWPMTYIAMAFCLVCLALLIITFSKLSIIRKIGASRQVSITYALIILWGLFYLSKLILADTSFFMYHDEYQENVELSTISKYQFILDISSVFILQTALVLIPLNWMVRIIDIFRDQTNYNTLETSGDSDRKFDFQKKCCIFLKVYIYGRFIYIAFLIVFCFPVGETIETTIATVLLISLLVQTFILFIMLYLGIRSLKNEDLSFMLEDAQFKTMKNQYIILIITTLTRFFNNGWYVYQNLGQFGFIDECNFDPQSKNYPKQSIAIVLFILQGILTHLLPIFIILRVYNVNAREIELSESLIAAEEQTKNAKEK